MNPRSSKGATIDDVIKDAAVAALERIIDPLIELMLDAGVTVHEFNKLVRERAVLVAMKRLTAAGNKQSKSRAAIMTGLPRTEIAKILKRAKSAATGRFEQLPARRLLEAWKKDPRFSAANGNAVLPIFGRVASFEQLVNRYGGGIPVRAMLDELTAMEAIDRLPDQKIKLRMQVPIVTGLNAESIAAVGERSSDLLQTLAYNRQHPAQSLFEGTAAGVASDPEVISSLRRDLAMKGAGIINEATSLLHRSELKNNAKSFTDSRKYRIGVTMFYFEEPIEIESQIEQDANQSRRSNLRRHRGRYASPKPTTSKT